MMNVIRFIKDILETLYYLVGIGGIITIAAQLKKNKEDEIKKLKEQVENFKKFRTDLEDLNKKMTPDCTLPIDISHILKGKMKISIIQNYEQYFDVCKNYERDITSFFKNYDSLAEYIFEQIDLDETLEPLFQEFFSKTIVVLIEKELIENQEYSLVKLLLCRIYNVKKIKIVKD